MTSPAVINETETIRAIRRISLDDAEQRGRCPACKTADPVSEEPRSTPIASYQADPSAIARVLLLYSGGLTVDLGQPEEDYSLITDKARNLGAVETIVVDAREEFAHEYVLPAVRANALYGGGYPLFTALGRPLIAKLAVEHARENSCDTIAHGCTGKGNDQVRIEATVATLAPAMRLLAPVREWQMGRDEEIAYAREHGIPITGGTEAPPYSIDDNLWGRSSEGKLIEDLDRPPPDDVFQLVTLPEEAPDKPETVRIGFEAGRPVSIDGEELGLVELFERASDLGRRHGVGIVDHVEDRIVGLKVRDLYEVPAAAIVLTAHKDLERLVSTMHQNNFKSSLETHWAYLCYAGLWHEPLREDLDAYMDSANEHVTGEVTMKLFKGSAAPVARSSPFALYDQTLASFGESGGEFSQGASPGFIELFSLQSRLAHRVHHARDAAK
jgi:argininosuccinate synthase